MQANIKENIHITYPLCWGTTGDRWIPTQKASNAESVPCYDVIVILLPIAVIVLY